MGAIMKESDFASIIASFTELASNYGPFFFALLFLLFLPFRAHGNMRKSIDAYPNPTPAQLRLIRESEFLVYSAWIGGIVLTAFAVGWWFYIKRYDIHVVDRNYLIRYEGYIRVSPDDVLDTLSRSDDQFMWLEYNPPLDTR